MYKIIGADGKEYGPISLEQLKQWIAQSRVNLQTRVQDMNTGGWTTAGEIPELAALLQTAKAARPTPAAIAPPPPAGLQQGMAITSLVLGICSVVFSIVCLGFLATIPAIICGHIAHNRARRFPNQYGGAGLAIAGFALGYLSLLILPIYAAILLPAMSKAQFGALSNAKSRAQEINCVNNLKQIGLAFKVWALDNGDQFPFNVSTNKGGTLELCQRGGDGFDQSPMVHFLVMSNELSTPRILVCPSDTGKTAAVDWSYLQSANVTYQVRSGTNVSEADPQQVLAVCPIHGHTLYVDGSVQKKMHSSSR